GGDDGGITICVSTAAIMSPCFAAGCPIASSSSVDVDGRALDGERASRLDVHAATGLDLRIGRRLDRHLLRIERDRAVRGLERDVLVARDRDGVARRIDDDAVLLAL